MPTPRKPTVLTTAAIDQFCAAFDDLFVPPYVHAAARSRAGPCTRPGFFRHRKPTRRRRGRTEGSMTIG
jgi:hypothetical protein